jgi:hypothetical protein
MRPSVLLLVSLAACATPHGTTVTPAELHAQEMQEAQARAAASEAGGGQPAAAPTGAAPGASAPRDPLAGRSALTEEQAKKRDDLDNRRTALARRREDQTRATFELDQRRKRTELDQQAAAAQEAVSLDAADREHRIAAEDLARFRAVDKPHRLAQDALSVQTSADGLLEADEELQQLKMMYSDSQLGDATAEIVLNRSERRLKRAQEGHRLRLEDSDELKNVTLPRDEEAKVQAEKAKAVALDNVKRADDKSKMEREAALRDLDFEARKLERETADITRDQASLDRDLQNFSRDVGNPVPQ